MKEQITDYWSQRADHFSIQRQKEFDSNKHDLWLDEFKRYLSFDTPLHILDLGTGTGFFTFLLAQQGHHVTGIDLTAAMITKAKQMSAQLNLCADFMVMDAENPQFAARSFDVLVTRNLTWTLPHLQQAYENWYQLLKPNGILINFDADYCHNITTPAHVANHAHKDISPSLMAQHEQIKAALRPHQATRPEWDVALLSGAGFRKITVDQGVWQRIYPDVDEFYNPTPIFTLVAYK